MFRFQPSRPKSYISKSYAGWLFAATILTALPSWAQSDATTRIVNQADYKYDSTQDGPVPNSASNSSLVQSSTAQILNSYNVLVDPLGVITGCRGEKLTSYTGYSVAVYNAASDRLNPSSLLTLTPTEIPDIPGNGVPLGLRPNTNNVNPFVMDANSDGSYNFLFNRKLGQLDVGKSYILVVKPPSDSTYGERRVRLDITGFNNDILSYQATSLDGRQLSLTSNPTLVGTVNVNNAAQIGLSLISLQNVGVGVCDAQPIQIIKSADRATAEPGDTVVYRLTLKNLSNTDIQNPAVNDNLPLGMSVRTTAIRAQLGDTIVPVTFSKVGNQARFQVGAPGFIIPAKQVVNLVYAVTLEVDAIRGTGRNEAILEGIRSDNLQRITDGPATHLLGIRPGLVRDTGTILGRVFVDKNFDGEQQTNEPGIPNAIIFMDDGNRITTDANGLFSVQSAVAGYRTGVLDIGSLPGYTLAPNLYFSERNSPSRLVKLAPGGIVRMNFGVTPTAREVK